MEALHTPEELAYFASIQKLACELLDLGRKYDNQEVIIIAQKYQTTVDEELEKYNSFIGIECTAPDSIIFPTGSRRKGKIEGNFYLSYDSKSICCDFIYHNWGFDTFLLSELI